MTANEYVRAWNNIDMATDPRVSPILRRKQTQICLKALGGYFLPSEKEQVEKLMHTIGNATNDYDATMARVALDDILRRRTEK